MRLTAGSSGCLTVYNQNGTNLLNDAAADPPQSPSGDDWVPETSLDLEMVSAICPNCAIDLIESNSDDLPDLATAENTAAVTLHAKFISNSWSGSDYPGESAYDSVLQPPGGGDHGRFR